MSHFYGTLQGNRGEATRSGSRDSGVSVRAASWQGCGFASVYFNEDKQEDWVRLGVEPWQGQGRSKVFYDGPVDGSGELYSEESRLLSHVADEVTNKAKKEGGSVTVTLPLEVYDKIRECIIRKAVDCA
jgi:hypothetical protein